MTGGPVPLSALGVREGDLGLVDVGDASFEANASLALDRTTQKVQVRGLAAHATGAWLGAQVPLPAEVTPWLAGPALEASVASIDLARDGTAWQAEMSGASLTAAWGQLAIGHGRLSTDRLELQGPVVKLSLDELGKRKPKWAERLHAVLDLRKVAEVPVAQPATTAAKPDKVAPERPVGRWQRQIHAAHAALGRVHGKLEAVWPLNRTDKAGVSEVHGKLRALRGLHVTGGALHLLDTDGNAGLSLTQVELALSAGTSDGWQVRAHATDPYGPIGDIGLRWQRSAHREHDIELQADGSGVAQFAHALVPGLHVSQGGHLRFETHIHVDSKRTRVEGRLEMDHIGIDWWRLSAKPIADAGLASMANASPETARRKIWPRASTPPATHVRGPFQRSTF